MRARVAKEIKNGTRISKLATLFRERNYGRTTRKATLEEVILERAPSPGRMICRSFRQEKSAEEFPAGLSGGVEHTHAVLQGLTWTAVASLSPRSLRIMTGTESPGRKWARQQADAFGASSGNAHDGGRPVSS